MFEIKIKSSDFPIFDKKDTRATEKESMNKLNNILLTIQNHVAIVTPVGATGSLRSSLKTTIRKTKIGKMIGSVLFGKKYAGAVNDGRKASPVSKLGQKSLRRWIQKSTKGRSYFNSLKDKYPKITLRSAVFLLARSMKQKERKGQEFFEKGIKNAKADINRIVSRLGTILVRGLAN